MDSDITKEKLEENYELLARALDLIKRAEFYRLKETVFLKIERNDWVDSIDTKKTCRTVTTA